MADGFGVTLETVCAGRVDGVVVVPHVDAIEGVMVLFVRRKVGKDSRGTVWHSVGPCSSVRNATLYRVADSAPKHDPAMCL